MYNNIICGHQSSLLDRQNTLGSTQEVRLRRKWHVSDKSLSRKRAFLVLVSRELVVEECVVSISVLLV